MFLLPVFAFACIQAQIPNPLNVIIVFFILHFFLYPASNGYNSYYDKDEDSIGGVKNPMPVSKELLYTSLSLDLIAICAGLALGWRFAVMLLVYGLVSKAYSHPAIRLKKYPVVSLLVLVLFQGIFTYGMVLVGIHRIGFIELFKVKVLMPGGICGLMLLGFYPLTQVYQHEEDSRRGDLTISLLLGTRGTFWFSTVAFLPTFVLFRYYFEIYFNNSAFWLLAICLSPAVIFFIYWFLKVKSNSVYADYDHATRFILLASTSLTLFCVVFYFWWYL